MSDWLMLRFTPKESSPNSRNISIDSAGCDYNDVHFYDRNNFKSATCVQYYCREVLASRLNYFMNALENKGDKNKYNIFIGAFDGELDRKFQVNEAIEAIFKKVFPDLNIVKERNGCYIVQVTPEQAENKIFVSLMTFLLREVLSNQTNNFGFSYIYGYNSGQNTDRDKLLSWFVIHEILEDKLKLSDLDPSEIRQYNGVSSYMRQLFFTGDDGKKYLKALQNFMKKYSLHNIQVSMDGTSTDDWFDELDYNDDEDDEE